MDMCLYEWTNVFKKALTELGVIGIYLAGALGCV
jgi:hypothetical protein